MSIAENQTVQAFHYPKDRLRITINEKVSYPFVKPVWASPLSRPGQNLSLQIGRAHV